MLQRIRYIRNLLIPALANANTQCTSKTIHNELISIGDMIRQSISQNLSGTCPYYSIIADELTDTISNQTVLSLCIRYLSMINKLQQSVKVLLILPILKGDQVLA